MGYTPPSLEELVAGIKQIREEYKTNNPIRSQLLNLIDLTHDFIMQVQTSTDLPASDKLTICLGAWEFCRQKIPSPDFGESYFYRGSQLRKKFTEQLKISKANNMDDRLRLIYFSKFFKYLINDKTPLVHNNHALLNELIEQKKLNINDIRKQLVDVITPFLKNFLSYMDSIERAIPTEAAMDHKLALLPHQYRDSLNDKKQNASMFTHFFNWINPRNPNREFYAQLAKAISEIVKEEKQAIVGKINESERIKIGALLYILQSIYDEYYFFRSPANNNILFGYSRLFHLCCEILHIKNINDYDHETILECMRNFEDFLKDKKSLSEIERYGNEHFPEDNLLNPIHAKAHNICSQITIMLQQKSNASKTNWPSVVFFAELFSIIGSAPGWALGWVSGSAISNMNETTNIKLMLAEAFNYIGKLALGSAGQYFGFWTANQSVEITFAYALASLLKQGGKGLGYLIGGAIGLIPDLTYKAFHEFFQAAYQLKLLKDVDIELVECFFDLPPEMFIDDKKMKMEQTLKEYAPDKEIASFTLINR